MSAVTSQHRAFAPQVFFENNPKSASKKALTLGYPQEQLLGKNSRRRLVISGAVSGNVDPADSESGDKDSDQVASSKNPC